jgi:hypothetical protein
VAALAEIEWEISSPHTSEEISMRLGLDLRSVKRIEARALEKLRQHTSSRWRGSLREPPALGRSSRRTDFGSDCRTPSEEE